MAMNKQRKTSSVLNILNYDDAGNIVIKDYGQTTRYSWNGTIHGFVGPVSISSVSAATTDTDKFIVSDGGVLKYRTGSEVLSDIGGVGGSGAAGQVAYWNGTSTQTGSNNLFWDAANARLGIGLINPQRKLEIHSTTADSHLRLSGSAPSVSLGDAITGALYQAKFGLATANGQYATGSAAGDFVILSQTGATLFMTSASERMRLTAAGRLLLGTTTEGTYMLDVNGSGRFKGLQVVNVNFPNVLIYRDVDVNVFGPAGQSIEFGARNGVNFITGAAIIGGLDNPSTTGNLLFQTRTADALTTKMFIDSNGKVGIGATSLYTKLQVAGTIGAATTDFTEGIVGTIAYMRTVATTGNTYGLIQTGGAGDTIGANLVINQYGGNLGIGNNNNPAYILDVTGTFRTTGQNTLDNLAGVGTRMVVASSTGLLSTQSIPTGNAGTVTSIATTGPITGGTITSSGTIGITQSTTSTDGYLSSADWNVFNGKQTQLNGTGFIKAIGTAISYDNSTYYLASNPSGFVNYNIYTSDGALSSDRTMDASGKVLTFDDSNGIKIITTPHTNNAIYIEAAEPNINLKAMGASNGAAVFFSPTNASYYGALHNRTGGGLQFYVGSAGSGGIPTVGVVIEPTKQLKFTAYTSPLSFTGIVAGFLAFDSNGNIITSSGAGGSGTVTSVATTGPITGGTITTSGTIGITQSGTSTDGYLSSTDWNTFNNKLSTNIYTSNGTLSGDRTILDGGFSLLVNPKTTFSTALTATGTTSSYSMLGQNVTTYPVAFSSSNLGNTYGASGSISLQTFLGNATFSNANLVAAHAIVNSIKFSVASSTITMTQAVAPSIRAMSANIYQTQFDRANSGTISHLAVNQNLGIYLSGTGSGVLTITNAYSLLINALDEYGAAGLSFTPTARWAIYQVGQNDNNYFRAKVIIGSTNVPGVSNLRITGLPTSSAGLNAGEVWNNGGVLNIV